jgi:dolichol kinase
MKKTKRAAIVFACVLFFAMLLSVLFIAHETNHECIGEDCQVCARLAACENSRKNISGAVTAAAAVAAVCFVFVRTLLCSPVLCAASSPVSLKVKLSD